MSTETPPQTPPIGSMDEEAGPEIVLARWPRRHGYWYLANAYKDSRIEFLNLIHPERTVHTTTMHLGPADIKPYPDGLPGGIDKIKWCSSADPLQAGDNVLAHVSPSRGTAVIRYGYEMGQVLHIGKEGDVEIQFAYGVTETVGIGYIFHMYLGGPTRLDYGGRAMYPRRKGPGNNAEFSVADKVELEATLPSLESSNGLTRDLGSTAIQSSSRQLQPVRVAVPSRAIFSSVSESSSTDIGEIEALNTVIKQHLNDRRYIRKWPEERKSELLAYLESFEELSVDARFSTKGEEFQELWVRLVRHHHHNLVLRSHNRITPTLRTEWFKD